MGTIFKATHLELDRPAAIKFLDAAGFASHDAVARFRDEARVCARMHHRNVVELFDFDLDCDRPYMVFEFIDGHSVKDMIDARMSVKISAICRLVAEICHGLQHAHSQGIVHRDLKPENILVTRQKAVKVADFGLAKMGGVTAVQTRTGVVLGTPVYMSPEQAAEKPPTPRSDLYSIGILLFELLAGTPPFDGPSDMDVLLKHLKSPPPKITDLVPFICKPLDNLVLALLQKEPEKRPESAAFVAKVLLACAEVRGDWKPDERSVILGCREGLLRGSKVGQRPIPQNGGTARPSVAESSSVTRASQIGQRAKARRPRSLASSRASASSRSSLPDSSTNVTKLSIISDQSIFTTSDGRRKLVLYLPALAVILIVLSYAYSILSPTSSDFRTGKLEVIGRGSNAVVVSFLASKRVEKPRLVISLKNTKAAILHSMDKPLITEIKGDLPYQHRVLVKGLKAENDYTLALRLPNEKTTLPRPFSTSPASRFHPVTQLHLTEAGELQVTFLGKKDFSVKVADEKNVASKRRTYVKEFSQHYDAETVRNNTTIKIVLKSIDGEDKVINARALSLLRDEFDHVFALLKTDRKSEHFFSMWSGGGRVNELFNDFGNRYVKNLNSKTIDPKKVVSTFWKQVETKLQKECNWYKRLQRILPGVPWLLRLPDLPEDLRQAISLSLVALELIDGSAGSFKIPGNSAWVPYISPSNRPYRLGYGSPLLPEAEKEFNFNHNAVIMMMGLAFVPLYDLEEPAFKRMLVKNPKRSALGNQILTLDLSSLDLAEFGAAELELRARVTSNPAMVIFIDLNGSFVATYRMRKEDFDEYVDSWIKENKSYTDVLMFLMSKPFANMDGLSESCRRADNMFPKQHKSYYHKIPLSCLLPKRNRVKLYAYMAPSDNVDALLYTDLKLRLKRK